MNTQSYESLLNDVILEVRTYLTSIRGHAECALDQEENHAPVADAALVKIIEDTIHVNQLTVDLMLLQSCGDPEFTPNFSMVNLDDLTRIALDTLSEDGDKSGAQISLSGEEPIVLGDPEELQKALCNVVQRVFRERDAAYQATVHFAPVNHMTAIILENGNPNAQLLDTMCLFERISGSSVQDKKKTGLELSVARAIIGAHGGRMESGKGEDGKGIRLEILLPSV